MLFCGTKLMSTPEGCCELKRDEKPCALVSALWLGAGVGKHGAPMLGLLRRGKPDSRLPALAVAVTASSSLWRLSLV